MTTHRCIDCGFLATRKLDTRQLEEVEREYDNTRHQTYTVIGEQGRIEDFTLGYGAPVCFVGQVNLHAEYPKYPKNFLNAGISESQINLALKLDRECDAFTKWKQGFTPKEHREMMDREWMQKHQDEREEADRKWRSKQEHYLVKIAGLYAIVAAVVGAGIGVVITWLVTRGGH
jgi:hypothetical protein